MVTWSILMDLCDVETVLHACCGGGPANSTLGLFSACSYWERLDRTGTGSLRRFWCKHDFHLVVWLPVEIK